MKKIIYIAIAALCVACTPPAVEESKVFLTEESAQELIAEGTILTLQKFKESYMSEDGNYCLPKFYRDRSKAGDYYLFSIDTIPASEKPIYIRGRITTDDYAGNFYKTLCIQQIFVEGNDTTQEALRISVDLGSANGLYQMGQEILIRVDGLAIGRYANQPQLCLPSYNNNNLAYNASEKVGWAAGRIPGAIFKARTYCIGLPDKNKLFYEPMQITDFTSITGSTSILKARNQDAKLVRIEKVHFTGQYSNNGTLTNCSTGDPELDENANVFAPTTGNLNYPQSRVIMDEDGKYTLVSTSEYAKFAHFYLPASKYIGRVVGILGFYYDNGKNFNRYPPEADDWSISIRSVDDLMLYDGDEHWLYDENGNYKPGYEYSKK